MRPLDLFVDGLAMFTTDGPAAAAPTLRRAVTAFHDDPLSAMEAELGSAPVAACMVWDFEGFHALAARQVQALRDVGGAQKSALGADEPWRARRSSPGICRVPRPTSTRRARSSTRPEAGSR